jgi:hypothetical protein
MRTDADVLLYEGRPVTSLSREELIEALTTPYRLHEAQRESHAISMSLWQAFSDARKL